MPILNRKQRKQHQEVPEPKVWLLKKLDNLEGEWRAGSWYMDLFESVFLCYLECWLVIERRPTEELWQAWEARCRARLPKGAELVGMNRMLDEDKERDVLLAELLAVKEQMLAAKPLPVSKPVSGGILDMLQGKDDEDE